MAGSWHYAINAAIFTPRFPVASGAALVVLSRADPGWRELAQFVLPGMDREPVTTVTTIEPGVDVVPANLLRFVVTFSSPMEPGSAVGRISLVDENVEPIRGALLDMPPELWDADRRRLTVLLEPGRFKRGLQPNVQAGPPLREGESVTLVVDSGVRDEHGSTLVAAATRIYRVGPSVRTRIDPFVWRVEWPETDADALLVRFDRPLDRTLVARYVRGLDERGRPVPGAPLIDDTAQAWSFVPIEPRIIRRLSVDSRLEDLAGNSVRRVFDRDLRNPDDDSLEVRTIELTPENSARA
jgi:hypothetical protein